MVPGLHRGVGITRRAKWRTSLGRWCWCEASCGAAAVSCIFYVSLRALMGLLLGPTSCRVGVVMCRAHGVLRTRGSHYDIRCHLVVYTPQCNTCHDGEFNIFPLRLPVWT